MYYIIIDTIHLKSSRFLLFFRYDFVLHADQANCIEKCGASQSKYLKKYSKGVFRMRFTTYMQGSSTNQHQEALLIYNKKGVPRSLVLSRLAGIEAESKKYKRPYDDKNDPTMWPILNFPNYAPFKGGKYKNKNFVAINELKACIGMNCRDHAHGMYLI